MRKFTKHLIFAIALVTVSGFVSADTAGKHTSVTSFANTGGNSVGEGGTVTTGNASASASVRNATNGSSGTTTVNATVTANGETKVVSKEVVGSDVSVEVTATASGTIATTSIAKDSADAKALVEVKNVTISHTIREDEARKGAREIVGSILSALRNALSYVFSFFKR